VRIFVDRGQKWLHFFSRFFHSFFPHIFRHSLPPLVKAIFFNRKFSKTFWVCSLLPSLRVFKRYLFKCSWMSSKSQPFGEKKSKFGFDLKKKSFSWTVLDFSFQRPTISIESFSNLSDWFWLSRQNFVSEELFPHLIPQFDFAIGCNLYKNNNTFQNLNRFYFMFKMCLFCSRFRFQKNISLSIAFLINSKDPIFWNGVQISLYSEIELWNQTCK